MLYGRGSVDAKGSLCVPLLRGGSAQANPFPIVGGWWSSVRWRKKLPLARGRNYVAAQFNPTMCIIGEPSGVSKITLGYKGRLLIDYRLTRAVAHTARPEPSVGALGAAFWSKIEAWAETRNAGIDGQFDRVTPHLRSINTQSDNFHDTLTMMVSFRLPLTVTPEELLENVRVFTESDGELRPYGLEYAYRSDRSNPLVRGMLAAMRSNGLQPGFVLKTGTSDMNVVGRRWNCPIIAYGPGDSNLDHTPNEHLPLAEYQQAIEVLESLIENLPANI